VIDVRDLPIRTDSGFAGVEALAEIEKRHIQTILQQTSWNISEAARRLGIHRNTLRLKIKEYGIYNNANH
jgi:DNA-binding NtrC family response regulator